MKNKHLYILYLTVLSILLLCSLWLTNSTEHKTELLSTQAPYIIKETVEVTSIVIITVTRIVYPTSTATPTPSATLCPTWTYEPPKQQTKTPTPTATPTMTISEYLTVNTANCSVNIRVEPNTSAVIIGAVKLGAVIQVLEIVIGEEIEGNNIWYRIKGGHFFNHSYPKEYYIWSGAKNLVPFVSNKEGE